MISKTLTTYAIFDMLESRGIGLLDIYVPLVCAVIATQPVEVVSRDSVRKGLAEKYGLDTITLGAIDTILRRMVKKNILQRENGVYKVIRAEVESHMADESVHDLEAQFDSLVNRIVVFAEKSLSFDTNADEVRKGLDTFLTDNDAEFTLDAGAAIAKMQNYRPRRNNMRYVISRYVIKEQKTNPGNIQLLSRLSKGHLIAEAATFANLTSYGGNMRNVTVALDTPIIFNLMGLNGESNTDLTKELLGILREKGAKLVVFPENISEVRGVLNDAIGRLLRGDLNLVRASRLLRYAVSNHVSATTLQTRLVQLDDFLESNNIVSIDIPQLPDGCKDVDDNALVKKITRIYTDNGERELLDYQISRIRNDVDTISYIFRLRGRSSTSSLTNCRAILVTTNTAIAFASRCVSANGVNHQIPPCVTDIFLSTLLWANFPKKNNSLNVKVLLSHCQNNISLDPDLLRMYYNRAEEMHRQGTITDTQLVQLTSSKLAFNILEDKTLNDTELFTDATPEEILQQLEFANKQKISSLEKHKQNIDARLRKIAHITGIVFFWVLFALLFIVFTGAPAIRGFQNKILDWTLLPLSLLVAYWGLWNYGRILPSKERIIQCVEKWTYNRLKQFLVGG